MKIIFVFLLSFVILTPIYAQESTKKWIPLQPMHDDEKPKIESNQSKSKSNTKMTQNLKIIKNLLDHVAKEGTQEDKKNWYSIEPSEE